jgi:hypothetical protein
MTAAGQTAFTSVFDWNPPRSRRRILIGWIAGSAVLHAFCFYIFQVIYPPTIALLPPPARVNIITPNSEDGRVLLQWIEAEDPALSSTTQRPPNASALELPRANYVPSFTNYQPALRDLPPYEPDLRIPSARPPAPVPRPRSSVAPVKVNVATAIKFANESERGAPQIPRLQFTASRTEPPQAAEFRIAIDDQGTVRHCFVETSSEDPALDEQARRYLMLCRFPTSQTRGEQTESALTWTTALIEWGNDFATPAPPPTKAVAP